MNQTSPTPPGGFTQAADDPSMEDILASIRRILNDGEPEGPETAAEPAPAAEDDVFVLDQTMLVAAPAPVPDVPEPVIDASPASTPALPYQEPAAMTAPDPEDIPHPEPVEDQLAAATTVAAASASMGALVRVVSQKAAQVYRGGPTIEDIVREEIRPLVKEWLDEHLPPLVERMVRAEIERVTRS